MKRLEQDVDEKAELATLRAEVERLKHRREQDVDEETAELETLRAEVERLKHEVVVLRGV
eukprot:779034-Rhodomonas_salina.1